MQTTAVDLITVSREYGAGGSDFARALGAALDWPVLDKDLPARVAARLHVQCGAIEERVEQAPGVLARFASVLLASAESPGEVSGSDMVHLDAIARAAHAELEDAAANPPAIIVGFGAQMIFQQRPHTLHVRLTGTPESRVERLVARDGVTADEAAASIRRMDAKRHAYVQRYYHRDWADPLLFEIQFNTGRLSIEQAVACVASIVAIRAGVRSQRVLSV